MLSRQIVIDFDHLTTLRTASGWLFMCGSSGRCRKNNSRLSNWVELRAYWSECETVALHFDIPLSLLFLCCFFFVLFEPQASAIRSVCHRDKKEDVASICSHFSVCSVTLSVWESGTIKSTTHQRHEGRTMTVTIQSSSEFCTVAFLTS